VKYIEIALETMLLPILKTLTLFKRYLNDNFINFNPARVLTNLIACFTVVIL
jgi:hypothetical protein